LNILNQTSSIVHYSDVSLNCTYFFSYHAKQNHKIHRQFHMDIIWLSYNNDASKIKIKVQHVYTYVYAITITVRFMYSECF